MILISGFVAGIQSEKSHPDEPGSVVVGCTWMSKSLSRYPHSSEAAKFSRSDALFPTTTATLLLEARAVSPIALRMTIPQMAVVLCDQAFHLLLS